MFLKINQFTLFLLLVSSVSRLDLFLALANIGKFDSLVNSCRRLEVRRESLSSYEALEKLLSP
jgi:hypothetical protein